MMNRHHLRKIYYNRSKIAFRQHDIEFVKIPVYNSVVTKPDDQIHQVVIQLLDIRYFVNVTSERRENSKLYIFHDPSLMPIYQTDSGCPITRSIITQCRLLSTGFGTGNPLSFSAFIQVNSFSAEMRDKYNQPAL